MTGFAFFAAMLVFAHSVTGMNAIICVGVNGLLLSNHALFFVWLEVALCKQV